MGQRTGTGRGGTADAAHRALLTIGTLSRACGVPVATLRTWETRYGYPIAERKPSGHRLYPVASVVRLRRIAEALARGHRASEVLPASDAELRALLETCGGAAASPAPPAAPPADDTLLAAVKGFNATALLRMLTVEWSRLGPLPFLQQRVAPLIQAVGDGWAAHRLDICHEHFLSERLGDLLRTLRLPFEERARGPVVILASLEGELHGLGLQMTALLVSVAGHRPCFLGTDLPAEQIAAAARDLGARAVGISISEAMRQRAARTQLARLRTALPRRLTLIAGGRGACDGVAGVDIIRELGDFDVWLRGLGGG